MIGSCAVAVGGAGLQRRGALRSRMVLVNLRSGEPFTAHLIVEAITPARLAGADAIDGASGDESDRAERDKPEFHDVRPGSIELVCIPTVQNQFR